MTLVLYRLDRAAPVLVAAATATGLAVAAWRLWWRGAAR